MQDCSKSIADALELLQSCTKPSNFVHVIQDLGKLKTHLWVVLSQASERRPVVILLASLDELDSHASGQWLGWLQHRLPPYVHIILSLSDASLRCYPELQPNTLLQIPLMTPSDGLKILNKWMEERSRTLTNEQWSVATQALSKCQLHLFLALTFSEVQHWTSFTNARETVLGQTLLDAIALKLDRSERELGKKFVSRVLGYITLSMCSVTRQYRVLPTNIVLVFTSLINVWLESNCLWQTNMSNKVYGIV